MKKIFLSVIAIAFAAITAQAQTTAFLNTSSVKLDFNKISTQTTKISLSRYLFAGYNTICLPFNVSTSDLQSAVGEGVQIERLAKADGNILYFLDVTSEGIEAGEPYLIYSPATKSVIFKASDTDLLKTPHTLTVDGASMFSYYEKTTPTGIYGIPATQDNDVLQSVLVRVDGEKSFLPTRCGISTKAESPEIRHITSLDETTAIKTLIDNDATVDIYTVSGSLVKTGISIRKAMNTLQKGMYVVNGQKFLVK